MIPFISEDSIDRVLDLHDLVVAHPAATFFIRVKGNSMQSTGIYSGDILVVDRAIEAKSGSVVVAILNGEFTVKRLSEIRETSDFQVWGVVTYVIQKMDLSRRL